MLFNSFAFVIFGTIVVVGSWALPGRRTKNMLLLAASITFYAYSDWKLLFLILLCAADGYLVGRMLAAHRDQARPLLFVGIGLPLVILGAFKYFGFFVDEIGRITEAVGLGAPDLALSLVLPVGISFYTFQTIGYVIDVHRGSLEPERDVLDFFLFVTFFPQLVAGPIERGTNLLPQIKSTRHVRGDDLLHGSYLIAQGYAKKVLIADNIKPIVDSIFALQDPSGTLLAIATLGFAVQIYGDFSGYTDIARGVARILGFKLLLNFRRPYWSRNPAEFWNRWHITLSNWFRDYVYIPLGGNRAGAGRTLGNLMTTMTLSGLWHGASLNFVLWGSFHGCVLIVHRLWAAYRPKPAPALIGWVGTMSMVLVGWLMFRVTSSGDLLHHLRALFTDLRFPGLAIVTLGTLMPYLLMMAAIDFSESQIVSADGNRTNQSWLVAPVITALLTLTLLFGSESTGDFIYFQF